MTDYWFNASSEQTTAAPFDRSRVGFYTEQRIERPRHLDGSLRFLRRGR